MGIPLVRNNSVDDINTSIIAIKKELGKGGSGDMGDVNVNVDVKYEVTDTVEDGNSLPVTSQGVYDYVEGQGFIPVDEVVINNMKAVTSNAVAKSLSYFTTEQKTGGKWIDGKDIYRKCIPITLPNESEDWFNITDVASIPNVDQYVNIWGISNTTNGFTQIMNGIYGLESNAYYHLYRSYTKRGGSGWLILEYTKTTD
jgi:hypothetical protein